MIQGRSAGNLGDLRVRAVASNLPRFIPGHPTVVNEYMPGAGGKKAINHLYRSVPADGLTMANIGSAVVSAAVLKQTGVQYDVDRLIYLGSGNSSVNNAFATRSEIGVNSLDMLRSYRGLRIGVFSVGDDLYVIARLIGWLLDLQDSRYVPGYSGRELDVAVIRGEVDANLNAVEAVIKRSPEWIEKKMVNFHVVFETPLGYRVKHPAFVHLPEVQSLTRTEWERKVVNAQRSLRAIGSPFVLPPGVPKERVAILRKAFNDMFKDAQFANDWKKLTGEDPDPLSAAEQEKILREIPREQEVTEFFHKIGGPGPLPPRR
jgi:tripartite-type tricarboxylate transporter receptor subunit TctC